MSRSHWTPDVYGLNGSDARTVYNDLVEAASAIARAEECIRRTYPHPRDGDVEPRRPAYIETLQRMEALFDDVQAEAMHADGWRPGKSGVAS